MKNLNFDKIEPNTIIDEVSNTEYYIGTSENGIDLEEIILKLKETPSEIINQEVKSLLEEGIIFEPRPGRLRWLG